MRLEVFKNCPISSHKKGTVSTHAEELQLQYSGKYIAVLEEEIIAVGDSRSDVSSKGRLVAKGKTFLIIFVEREDLPEKH